jgi:secreted trypsin-like serine protease
MKNIFLVSVLSMSFFGCGQNSNQGSATSAVLGSVVNGTSVIAENNYSKSTVGIRNLTGSICSGVIIEKDLILTAAHCLYNTPADKVEVVFGFNFTDGLKLKAKNVIVHEKYNTLILTNDIAMIRLQEDVPQNFQAVDLEDSRQINLSRKDKVTSQGYGIYNYETHAGAGELRETTLTIKKYENDAENIILNQKDGSGICFGDSGGPTYTLVNGRVALVGIASNVRQSFFGRKHECANKAALVNPNYFYNWINNSKLKI